MFQGYLHPSSAEVLKISCVHAFRVESQLFKTFPRDIYANVYLKMRSKMTEPDFTIRSIHGPWKALKDTLCGISRPLYIIFKTCSMASYIQMEHL